MKNAVIVAAIAGPLPIAGRARGGMRHRPRGERQASTKDAAGLATRLGWLDVLRGLAALAAEPATE